jgi:hypothetical protein
LNCITAFEEDVAEMDRVKVVRIEDFLKNPKLIIMDLCSFLDINFTKNMLPSSKDKVPYFTRYNLRWYPLRKELNDKYLKCISQEEIGLINKITNNLPEKYGYYPNLY